MQNHIQLTRCTSPEGNMEAVPALERTRDALQARRSGLLKTVYSQDSEFGQVRMARSRELSDSALRDGEWALTYQVTDSATLVFLTRGKSIEHAVIQPVEAAKVRALVEEFRRPFDLPGPDGQMHPEAFNESNLAAGYELYRLLVSPVVGKVPEGVNLIVVPDDCLGVLPFEMLPTEHGAKIVAGAWFPKVQGARFLGDRNSIVYCQSITALTFLRARETGMKPGDRFLVIADPVIRCRRIAPTDLTRERKKEIRDEIMKLGALSPGDQQALKANYLSPRKCNLMANSFPELKETSALARDVSMAYGPNTNVYTRERASLAVFEQEIAPQIKQFGRVLFATHGMLRDDAVVPEPALLLSTVPEGADSWLKMSRIADLDMSAEIVALVACQTGLGERISGEGTMGMGRAFHLAGAKGVLMSLWSVEVTASMELAKTFFENLNRGQSNLSALQAARRHLRETQGGKYDHPFFWAAFVLAGESD